jgi:hypothetical protein
MHGTIEKAVISGRSVRVFLNNPTRSKTAATIIAALLLLSSIRAMKNSIWPPTGASDPVDYVSLHDWRLAGLRDSLSGEHGKIGYLSEENPKALEASSDQYIFEKPKLRYRLTQYNLVPLLLQPVTPGRADELRLTVAYFQTREGLEAALSMNPRLQVVKDFGGGLALLQSQKGRP